MFNKEAQMVVLSGRNKKFVQIIESAEWLGINRSADMPFISISSYWALCRLTIVSALAMM